MNILSIFLGSIKMGLVDLVTESSPVATAEKKISQFMQTYLHWVDLLKNWLIQHGVGVMYAELFKVLIVLAIIVLLAVLADFITKRIILSIVYKVAKRTETVFDDILVEKKVFHRMAHLAPPIVIYYTIGLPLSDFPGLLAFALDGLQVYMIVVGLMILLAFINAVQTMYSTLPISKNHSIKGYLQVVKIILYTFAVIFIISAINDTSPVVLLTGLAGFAAVLMLIFKDTILGLVASIQLSVNDMLRPGDWIEMPSRKADGVVQDISLTTIKVQNWDNTITTIPTYSLVADSFTNWRGMEESEGRRIKKSFSIDMKSVRFYSDDMSRKLSENSIITGNFDVMKFVSQARASGESGSLTNLTVFRVYIESYLSNLPLIHKELSILVHYLQPTEYGLPLEIIAFSREKGAKTYELLQCRIIDHILAVLPEFELRIFQRPMGENFDKSNLPGS